MSRKLPAPAKSPERAGISNDIPNIILLVVLYLLQGVPLGLCFGSIPFLLKSKLSFSDLAIFSLSSYPYSLKLLWSPFVDSCYIKSIGRRKSWIIPTQLVIGLGLIFLGLRIDDLMGDANITQLTIAFTLLIFLCATQDIAVDGWALTLLNDDNKVYNLKIKSRLMDQQHRRLV
jgi:PAT family acetyl-CoA transporter-like MFS transporter 1